ncbi:MAG: winged helix-turn-helix transcriptional regulator [Sedimentisphaerales bacterium]|nr:winged helix-turn-helix transcriptional regulator [Sedimentisphaerales bacterium]
MNKNKRLLYEKQAEIAKSMAHPLRMAILDFLNKGDQCVCDIAEYAGSERSNVSRHLAVMVNAGILGYRKEGLKVIYSLKCKCVTDFFACAMDVIKQQAKENEKLLRAL